MPKLLAAVIVVCAATVPLSAVGQTQTRQSWQEFAKDPVRVERFREAVRVMKSRDAANKQSAEYRTSWQYWAAMHGYFGSASKTGTVQSYIAFLKARGWLPSGAEKFYKGVPDLTPPDSIARTVWDQCEHGSNANFLLWHRLYLMQFEQVLRAAVNDDTLRLPYWDYSDVNHIKLPMEFRSPTYVNSSGKTVENPLYEWRRATSWQTGSASLDSTLTDVDRVLRVSSFAAFQGELESDVHGYVHCSMNSCPVPAMGEAASAASDPIFWLHHANIDRVFSCWAKRHSYKIEGPTRDYSFVDPQGNLVTLSTSVLFAGKKLDYEYDKVVNCEREPDASLMALSPVSTSSSDTPSPVPSSVEPRTLGSVKNVRVRGNLFRATVKLDAPGGPAPASTTGNPASVPGRTTELHLKGLQTDAQPGVIYKVYVGIPGSDKQEVVGSLSFFRSAAHPNHKGHQAPRIDRVMDITAAAARLGATDVSKLQVVFEANTGRIGDAAKAMANPKSVVQIREITVEVK